MNWLIEAEFNTLNSRRDISWEWKGRLTQVKAKHKVSLAYLVNSTQICRNRTGFLGIFLHSWFEHFWIKYVYVCMCVCVFVLCPLLFPYRGGRTQAFSSASLTDKADFKMCFLPSNLMEEISPNTEALNTNTKSHSSAWRNRKENI